MRPITAFVLLATITLSVDGRVDIVNNSNNNGPSSPRVKRFPEHLGPLNFSFMARMGECPLAIDGTKKHFCPTPGPGGRWVCIDDYQLCDGIKHCPNAEDESSDYCMFYRVLKSQVELLTRSVSTLGKSVEEQEQEPSFIKDMVQEEDGLGTNKGPHPLGKSEHPHHHHHLLKEQSNLNRFHRQSGKFLAAI